MAENTVVSNMATVWATWLKKKGCINMARGRGVENMVQGKECGNLAEGKSVENIAEGDWAAWLRKSLGNMVGREGCVLWEWGVCYMAIRNGCRAA
jgi:hypothetical protein